jgi:hypothetical protein
MVAHTDTYARADPLTCQLHPTTFSTNKRSLALSCPPGEGRVAPGSDGAMSCGLM